MKKYLLSTFVFIILANVFMANNVVFAQKITKKNKKLAKELCACGEKLWGQLPKVMQEMFFDIATLGEEKASIKFMEKVGKFTEAERKELEAFGENTKNLEDELEKACETPDSIFDSKTDAEKNAILQFMKKDKKCQLAYAVRYLELKDGKKDKEEKKSEPAKNPDEKKN